MKADLNSIIEQLKECTLPRAGKMIAGVPLSALEGATIAEASHMLQTDSKPENDILKRIYDAIDTEKQWLIENHLEFYTATPAESFSLEKAWGKILERSIRIHRLMMVYSPVYYKSQSPNKAGGEKYDMVKIHWINEQGKGIRLVTKTYGRLGKDGLESSMPKLLEAYFDDLAEYKKDVKHDNGMVLDLVAKIGNESWAFEFKASNKDEFIETGVRLELWRTYKARYLKK